MNTQRPPGNLLSFRIVILIVAIVSSISLSKTASAQFPGQKTYCNPIDIDYKYNFEQQARGISFRSGADPVIVNHKGEYFLFVTSYIKINNSFHRLAIAITSIIFT